jgi:hypothetical protein
MYKEYSEAVPLLLEEYSETVSLFLEEYNETFFCCSGIN